MSQLEQYPIGTVLRDRGFEIDDDYYEEDCTVMGYVYYAGDLWYVMLSDSGQQFDMSHWSVEYHGGKEVPCQ